MDEIVKQIVVWGASGHASVVLDILSLNDEYRVVGFLDDTNVHNHKKNVNGKEILGGREQLKLLYESGVRNLVVAIGNCAARMKCANYAEERGFTLINVVHPRAVISSSAVIGKGVTVMAGAVVNPGVILGDCVIVNTSATIDHDVVVGKGSHICPGVTIAGSVKIGELVWVGLGSVVKEKVSIGSESIIGAGSVVISDVPSNKLALGVPSRVIRDLP